MTNDLSRLQGTWRVATMEMNGAAVPPASFANARVEVNGDRFVSLGMATVYEGVMTLDEAASPKRFSIKFDKGPESGNFNHAIYDLDGDNWRLCINIKGGPAPAAFGSKAGEPFVLETLVRAR